MNIKEEFKEIKGYNKKYFISNFGRVFTTDYRGNKVWKEMKQRLIKGYKSVGLRIYENGVSKQTIYKIHRLVATYFIKNPYNKPVVNHIDGNKQNNIVSNLEWVTTQENTRHAYNVGLEKTWWTRELAKVAINLLENYNYSYGEVAKLFKLNPTQRTAGYCRVRNLYERGFKTFNLQVKYKSIKKVKKSKIIPKQYLSYIKQLLRDNTVLN